MKAEDQQTFFIGMHPMMFLVSYEKILNDVTCLQSPNRPPFQKKFPTLKQSVWFGCSNAGKSFCNWISKYDPCGR